MSFFKIVFATVIGFFVAFFLFFVFLTALSLSSSTPSAPFISKTSVLVIPVSGPVYDRIPNDPFADFAATPTIPGLSLEAVRTALDRAASDERIKAVWLQTDVVDGSWALLGDIRKEVLRFRERSGKPVYASAADIGMNEASWFVASAADSVFAPAEALFEFDGFYVESYFLKGLFDNVGIEPEIMRFGKYKSAVEPYIATEFSKENEAQLKPLLGIVSSEFATAVADFTGLDTARVHALLNEAPRLSMQFALNTGMIHAAAFPEDVEKKIQSAIGDTGKLNDVTLEEYLAAGDAEDDAATSDGKIALLYLNGIIVPEVSEDFGDATGISYSWFDRQADAIEKDKSVKAVVLRIDSPGGSGTTSDLIWNRINRLREHVPVIASIGDVAASGGYYIAMAADTVVAYPSSVTGSIGVFSTKFNAQKLFNDKLGVTFDGVKTHAHADWFTVTKPLTPVQREAFQKAQDDFYATFIQRTAQSRGMETAQVDSVGQGRVWTGADAQKAGLVDVLGDYRDAMQLAADRAGLLTFETVVYPKRKSFLDVVLSGEFDQMQTRVRSVWAPVPALDRELKLMETLVRHERSLNCLLPVTPRLR